MSYQRHSWINFETTSFCRRCLCERKRKPSSRSDSGTKWVFKTFLLDTFCDKVPVCKDFKHTNKKWLKFEPNNPIELTEEIELFCADGSLRHKYDFDLGYNGTILFYRNL